MEVNVYDLLDIYEKERIRRDIKENSIRKYTEDVRKEIIKLQF